MPKRKSTTQPDIEKLKRLSKKIATHAELQTLHLVEASCNHAALHSRPQHLTQRLQTKTGIDTERALLQVLLRFSLARPSETDSDSQPVGIQATYLLLFSSDELSFSEDELTAFAGVTGAFMAWPYWREFVQSMTARMALPPLTLPLFQVHQVEQEDEPPPRKTPSKRKSRA